MTFHHRPMLTICREWAQRVKPEENLIIKTEGQD